MNRPAEEAPRPRDNRRRTVLVIAAIVVLGVSAALLLNAAQEDPGPGPNELGEAQDVRGDAPTEKIDLESGENSIEVVVQAPEKVCWNGYVGEHAIEGCGEQVFDVTSVPDVVGVNATKIDALKTPLRISVLLDDVVIYDESTKEPNGSVALTVSL